MGLSNKQLIAEGIECNHAGIGPTTIRKYEDHLVHFAQYLASAHGSDFYGASKKQVRLFMGHLEKPGGANPDPARLRCEWCRVRGYPDGLKGPGWSASYRKSYLSAVRFLYHHFQADDELPDLDPTVLESSPRVINRRGYTPTRDEVKRLLETEGPPPAVLLVHWLFYAPSRRETYADARWPDIDLDVAEWEVVGKNAKVDIFPLAPPLIRALRIYRRWQLSEAERRSEVRDALADPEKAYVLMTIHGKKGSPSTATKIATWHGIRARVGMKKATPGIDAVNGMTSRVTPHCFSPCLGNDRRLRPHPGQCGHQLIIAEQVVDGVVDREHQIEFADQGQPAHVGDAKVHALISLPGSNLEHRRRDHNR